MAINCAVHALDILTSPSSSFETVKQRAKDLGSSLTYHHVDVRNAEDVHAIVESIAQQHGRLDGLIAAAGIQQETPALEYAADDINRMLSVNVTGCFLTAQAVAKQMLKFGTQKGSIVLIGSMSGTVANRVYQQPTKASPRLKVTGPYLSGIQCFQSSCHPAGAKFGKRVGTVRYPGEYHISRLHSHSYDGGVVRKVSRAERELGE